jgi:cardiolipin synthase
VGDVEPGAGRRDQVAARPPGQDEPPARADAGPVTLANALTALRLFAAPVFLALYVAGDLRRALAVYAVAAATDLVDGLVARALDQHSRLGEILDPLADKLLAFCALVALATAGRLPVWLPVLVVGRDAVLVAGAAVLQVLDVAEQIAVAPTRAGKYATFALALLVLGELASDLTPALHPVVGPWLPAAGLLAAACVVISLLQYSGVFARAVRRGVGLPESR